MSPQMVMVFSEEGRREKASQKEVGGRGSISGLAVVLIKLSNYNDATCAEVRVNRCESFQAEYQVTLVGNVFLKYSRVRSSMGAKRLEHKVAISKLI